MPGIDPPNGLSGHVLEHSPLAVVGVGPDRTVRFWNAAAARLLGWPPEEVLGHHDPSVPPAERIDAMERLEALARDPESGRQLVTRRLRPDGHLVEVVLEACEQLAYADGPGLVLWYREALATDAMLVLRTTVSRRLMRLSRRDELVPIVTEAVRELLAGDAAMLVCRRPGEDGIDGALGFGVPTHDVETVHLDVDDPRTPWVEALRGVVRDGQLVVGDVERAARFVPMGPEGSGCILAVLDVPPSRRTQNARAVATALADEVYTALQRIALVDQLDAKIEVLEATNELASSVGLELDEALRTVARQAAAALGCRRTAVYLVDESDRLRLAHVHDDHHDEDVVLRDGDGVELARAVAMGSGPVHHADVRTVSDAVGPWGAAAGVDEVLGVPLRVGGRVTGVLLAATTRADGDGFGRRCLDTADAVARQAAIAFEQARLYSIEQDTVARLREIDRMKADWMAGITHDLKTPLTGLLGFVETFTRMDDRLDDAQRAEFLAAMSRQATKLVELVEDLLLSARVEADSVARRRDIVALDELVTQVVEALGPGERDGVEVVGSVAGATVLGDAVHLERVVQNLLANALRHGDGPVVVELAHSRGEVLVAVEDDGEGVPAGEEEVIFDRFSHGGAHGSTGLGLYVARGIVEAHGGSLVVEPPALLGGARFVVRLPHNRRQREADLPRTPQVDLDSDPRWT